MAAIEHEKRKVRMESIHLSTIEWIVNVLAYIAVFVKAAIVKKPKGNDTIDIGKEMKDILEITKPLSMDRSLEENKPVAKKTETKTVTELVWEKRERYKDLFD